MKMWRKQARIINLLEGKKHQGRILKAKMSTFITKAPMPELLWKMFENVNLNIKKESVKDEVVEAN